MGLALLDAWSTVEHKFYCRRCAFTDGIYDVAKAMSRYVEVALYMLHQSNFYTCKLGQIAYPVQPSRLNGLITCS